ncbi:Sps4p Ecym_1492 [Eremothecium cymbalariae DBVPG|uniref:Uncharacterized protein n=1 Tax=Eremothecium cymbalariae (strain CBS 270.75 / DBVPG 7215 / KCTC 17166 / NRRL Y-17582) TaxID=931890 RepID=G8JMJ9_ERECY|nr:hypothetical protein Ecym_1492 [Eremothecium cymbalariae DBVPG\
MSRLFHKKERQEVEEAAPVSEDVPNGAGDEQPKPRQSKALAHIGSYPLVQQTKNILDQLPPARIIVANTKPTVVAIINSKPVGLIRPVTNVADHLVDKTLSVSEKIVPSMKTKTYQRLGEELMLPYTLTKTVIIKTTSSTANVAHTYFYEPTHEQILKFRKYYNEKVIDTHGKPLIRGSLDFIVGPANKQYEKLITKVLPEGKQVPTSGFSNEVDRSFALTFNMVTRLIPAAAKKTSKVIWTPCNYVKHVNGVFNENLDKQEDLHWGNSWKAAKEAVAELNQETIGHVRHIIPGGGHRPFASRIESEVAEQELLQEQLQQLQQEQDQQLQRDAGVVA